MTASLEQVSKYPADDDVLDITEADIVRWQNEAIAEACNPTPMSEAEIGEILDGLGDLV